MSYRVKLCDQMSLKGHFSSFVQDVLEEFPDWKQKRLLRIIDIFWIGNNLNNKEERLKKMLNKVKRESEWLLRKYLFLVLPLSYLVFLKLFSVLIM